MRRSRLDLKLFEFSTSHQISLHVGSPVTRTNVRRGRSVATAPAAVLRGCLGRSPCCYRDYSGHHTLRRQLLLVSCLVTDLGDRRGRVAECLCWPLSALCAVFSCWSAQMKLIVGQSSVISQVCGSFSP